MQVVHFFGYLDDLSKTVALINLSEKNSNILFKAEELFEYKERFSAFSRLEDVPLSTQPLKLRAVAAPEFSMSEGSLTMQHLQSGKKYSFPTSGGEEPIQVK